MVKTMDHKLSFLTDSDFKEGLEWLGEKDKDMARVVNSFGPPPFWVREPGFPTLILIILEQQVSLASAKAAFQKLKTKLNEITPERFLDLNDEELKKIGFSRQKTSYGRDLAERLKEKSLELEKMAFVNDDTVRSKLMSVKGIGRWTADIYLLMALRRPDVWPRGDLALHTAMRYLKNLPTIPDREIFDSIGDAWRPRRAVAARILWHYYLSRS